MDTINSIGNAKQNTPRRSGRVIVGKDEVMIKVLLGHWSRGGHHLMEDIPGVGKTTMALAFSQCARP